MKPKTAAVFALGLAFGTVCLAVGLWASGAIVAVPPPWKKSLPSNTSLTTLPALPEVSMADVMADLGSVPPPPPPAMEPFAFPEVGSSPASVPAGASSRSDFVGPIAPGTPPQTTGKPSFIGPLAPMVGPLPDSPARAIGPSATGTRPKTSTWQGEADRIASDAKSPHLAFPLAGIDPKKIPDTFNDARGAHPHEALDIMAPRGTPVMAVAEGNVAKLFTSKDGGLTVYQFDNSRTLCFYYAHLDHYAAGIQDGTLLRPGQILGYVGSTGNASANAPHLHFALFRLGPEKKWWHGAAIDPLPLFQ